MSSCITKGAANLSIKVKFKHMFYPENKYILFKILQLGGGGDKSKHTSAAY